MIRGEPAIGHEQSRALTEENCGFADPLTEVLRNGAQALLAQAV
jgi:hypothetical protein